MSTAALQRLLDHPAPGLVFGEHEWAGVGERAYATPHQAGPRPSSRHLKMLTSLVSEHQASLQGLIDVYSRMDGVGFCKLWDSMNKQMVPALQLLPLKDWEEMTDTWRSGDCASFMEGCEIYSRGEWRVIGISPSGINLVMFFNGTHEGTSLAGRMFCIGLGGVLGFEEELAPNFGAFAEEFASNPAAFFDKVGFTWTVESPDGMYGDPVAAYVPDVRGHPKLTRW